jgi:hypothetical protein
MGNKLNIDIGVTGVSQTVSGVNQVAASVKGAGAAVSNAVPNINKLSPAFAAMQSAVAPAVGSLGQLGGAVQQTATQVPQFTSAVNTAGGAAGGFKSAVTQLAAGMFSLHSVLILAGGAIAGMVINYLSGANAAKELTEEQKKLIQGMQEIARETGKEIVQLDRLYKEATNAGYGYRQRKEAVDELQRQYPAYFKNMADEVIMAGKASGKYKELRDSIIQSGIAKVAVLKAQPLFEDLFELEKQLQTFGQKRYVGQSFFDMKRIEGDILNIKKRIDRVFSVSGTTFTDSLFNSGKGEEKAKKISVKIATTTHKGGKVTDPFTVDITALEDNFAKAKAAIVKLNTEIFVLMAQGKTEAELGVLKDVFSETQQNEILKAEETFLKNKVKIFKKYSRDFGALILEIATVEQKLLQSGVSKSVKLPEPEVIFNDKITKRSANEIADPRILAIGDGIDGLNDKIKTTQKLIEGVLGPVFDQFFNNMERGGKSAIASFGEAMKSLVVELGKAIAKALVFAAIQTAISGGSFTFAKLFGNFKSQFGALSGLKLATGGVANRPTYGTFGEAGPEAVIPLNRLPEMMRSMMGDVGGGSQTAPQYDLRMGFDHIIIAVNHGIKSGHIKF